PGARGHAEGRAPDRRSRPRGRGRLLHRRRPAGAVRQAVRLAREPGGRRARDGGELPGAHRGAGRGRSHRDLRRAVGDGRGRGDGGARRALSRRSARQHRRADRRLAAAHRLREEELPRAGSAGEERMKSPAQDLLETPPYGLARPEKDAMLSKALSALTRHHYEHCDTYRHIVDRVFGGLEASRSGKLTDIPFLPVSLFKTHELKSVPDSEVIKVLTSSGTSGQSVSRVYLDAETARVQSAVLVKIVQHFLGKDRLPMVILDHAG